MDYILGISGRDSCTNVNIATLGGSIMQSYTVGAINSFYADEDEISRNLAEAFVTAHMAGYAITSCRQICLGVAGIQTTEQNVRMVPVMRNVMRRCGYTGDAIITGDEQIALAGALGGVRGAILIADNSTACFGQNRLGLQHRTGGMGVYGDDDGSAYAIGREILRAVAKASDGRGPVTALTMQTYRTLEVTGMAELNKRMCNGEISYDEVCRLWELLAKACQMRDRAAFEILDKVSAQLIDVVSPVIDRLSLKEETLAVAGKVLLSDAFVGISFKKRLNEKYPKLQCVPPRSDAAAGAVLMAKERLELRVPR